MNRRLFPRRPVLLSLTGLLILGTLTGACSGGRQTGQALPSATGPTAQPAAALIPSSTPVEAEEWPSATAPEPAITPTAAEPTPALIPSEPQEVSIPAAGGLTLQGTFYPAQTGEPPWPAVLLMHMHRGNRGQWENLVPVLGERGYAALAFDLRGHGETGGDEDWEAAVEDVQAAWQVLIARPEVDPARTALVGASIGSNLALTGAAANPEIQTAVALSPGLDYFGVKPGEGLSGPGAHPVLILASENDNYAAESSKRLLTLAPEGSALQIYAGSAHGTVILDRQPEAAGLILDWLDQQVKGESGALETQPVAFTTADGLTLRGQLHGRGQNWVILSNMSDSPPTIWDPLLPGLLEQGYRVLTYDYRGRGGSDGRPSFPAAADDLRAAVDFARAQGAERVALVGASLGGMAVGNVAAEGEFAAAVILSAPTGTSGFEVPDAALAASEAPKLFVNSEGDRFIEDTRHMFAAAGEPKTLQIYPGNAHGTDLFATEHGPDLINLLLEFLAAHLSGG